MLLKDIYKLGDAGDVKKVAAGYARNYLIPQGLAVMVRPGVLKQAERIRKTAAEERARLNEELADVAEKLAGLELKFPVKAGETGRLYGSVTSQMIATAIETATGTAVERRDIETQPIKLLGVHTVPVRLTLDLVPEITLLIYREGEPAKSAYDFSPEEAAAVEAAAAEAAAEMEAGEDAPAEDEPAAEAEPEAEASLETEPETEASLEAEPEAEAPREAEPEDDQDEDV
jgi:large subunit ribosomal protein L9